jgi:hypothetical protein
MTKINLVAVKNTCRITVTNRSTWAKLNELVYTVFEGSDLTIPLTFVDGSDSSCVSVSTGTVSQNGITLTNVRADAQIIITDAKVLIECNNGDTEAINSITPSKQFVLPSGTAVFTLSFNTGYDSTSVVASSGTISGNTVSVPANGTRTSTTITPRLVTVTCVNNAEWVVLPYSTDYQVRYGHGLTIQIPYTDGADYTCLASVSGVTFSSTGATLQNVVANRSFNLMPGKVQVKIIQETNIIRTISPEIAYVTKGSIASFSFTLNSGFISSDLNVSSGSISENTIQYTTSTSGWYQSITVGDNLYRLLTDFSTTHSSTTFYPTQSSYRYSLNEQIYLASELNFRGTILQIGIMNAGYSSRTRTMDIYLQHTSKTNFSSSSDWTNLSTSYRYYSGSVNLVAGKWTYITLATPFTYNGSDNLMIAVDDNTGSSQSGCTFNIADSSDPERRVIYTYSNSTNYSPSNATSYSGTRNTWRNVFELVIRR